MFNTENYVVLKGSLYLLFICGSIECGMFQNLEIHENENHVEASYIRNPTAAEKELRLQFNTGQVVDKDEKYENRSTTHQYHHASTHGTSLIISKFDEHCHIFSYSSHKPAELVTRIDTQKLLLYGGAEHKQIQWPVNGVKYNRTPYVTRNADYQAILEPYWLTSNGYCIYVDDDVPLFITADPERGFLKLIAKNEAPYRKENTKLTFKVCQFDDARKAHEYAVEHFLGKPTGIPDERRVRYPIWSTWVKFKEDIDEKKALAYAKEIAEHGYGGQVEIDDNWETCYGSLIPNGKKFPDLKKLVDDIKRLKFGVTIWIHPFVNTGCSPVYEEGVKNGYFVRNHDGSTATSWWQGTNGTSNYVDFTNPRAVEWFRNRLENLRITYGIDSFKFDGGESSFSPEVAKFHVMREDHPETIVKEYVKMIASLDTNVHTRVARGTQQYPIFVTMMDRDSNWSNNLGLPTLIPQLLQMNMLGYSFVLPDMIGGNFYGEEPQDKELFIRWTQTNVFMPSLQFSMLPWQYGEEVNKWVKKFVELHEKYADKILDLMRKNVETGAPVNPPIWWIAPTDPDALACDTEFLLGEELLVAPVLKQGAKSRNIYLPNGFWRDENSPHTPSIRGPVWLNNYEADLHVLPYFTKLSEDHA